MFLFYQTKKICNTLTELFRLFPSFLFELNKKFENYFFVSILWEKLELVGAKGHVS